ncbi:hypothetical protein GJ496_004390 [Pomphorhynchus laevis]|nr:hypothetical protein GJ496_004390 [Pomphorhynchus laevis]
MNNLRKLDRNHHSVAKGTFLMGISSKVSIGVLYFFCIMSLSTANPIMRRRTQISKNMQLFTGLPNSFTGGDLIYDEMVYPMNLFNEHPRQINDKFKPSQIQRQSWFEFGE